MVQARNRDHIRSGVQGDVEHDYEMALGAQMLIFSSGLEQPLG